MHHEAKPAMLCGAPALHQGRRAGRAYFSQRYVFMYPQPFGKLRCASVPAVVQHHRQHYQHHQHHQQHQYLLDHLHSSIITISIPAPSIITHPASSPSIIIIITISITHHHHHKPATQAANRIMFGKEAIVQATPAKTIVNAIPVAALQANI